MKILTVDLRRVTRIKILVPDDIDPRTVSKAVQRFYDGTAMYGSGEEDGNVVLVDDEHIENAVIAIHENPQRDEYYDNNAKRAIAAYWRWVKGKLG